MNERKPIFLREERKYPGLCNEADTAARPRGTFAVGGPTQIFGAICRLEEPSESGALLEQQCPCAQKTLGRGESALKTGFFSEQWKVATSVPIEVCEIACSRSQAS